MVNPHCGRRRIFLTVLRVWERGGLCSRKCNRSAVPDVRKQAGELSRHGRDFEGDIYLTSRIARLCRGCCPMRAWHNRDASDQGKSQERTFFNRHHYVKLNMAENLQHDRFPNWQRYHPSPLFLKENVPLVRRTGLPRNFIHRHN